jgi:hypothetical protein
MADPIVLPTRTPRPVLTLAQKAANIMLSSLTIMRANYDEGRRLTFGPAPRPFTPEQVAANWVAIATDSPIQLTAERWGRSARVAKAVVNDILPGTIVDDVPEALIFTPSSKADCDAAIAILQAVKASIPE